MKQLLIIWIFGTCIALCNQVKAQGIYFPRDMAPSEGWVKPQEQPYRAEICLNGYWQFQPKKIPQGWISNTGVPPELPLPDDKSWEPVPLKIPSPWNVNSILHDKTGQGMDSRTFPGYPEEWENVKMGWLRKKVIIPETWKGRDIFIRLMAVAGDCNIYVNNKRIAHHFDNALPGEFDITSSVIWGKENEILLGIRDAQLYREKGKYGSLTYPTGSFWLMGAIGVWQDIFLLAKPKIHVTDIFVKPLLGKDLLSVDVELQNTGSSPAKINLEFPVYEWINKSNLSKENWVRAPEPSWMLGDEVFRIKTDEIELKPGEKKKITLETAVKDRLKKWEVWTRGKPNLYAGIAEIKSGRNIIDRKYQRFGWREAKIDKGDFFLNGRSEVLLHEGWHFTGIPCMSRRYAWAWYTLSKDAWINFVRPHAMPYPSYFYDMADEMGMMIMNESGIFGSHVAFNYESEDFWARNREHIERLVMRDRNHPSVVGWSVSNEIRCVLIWQAKNDPGFQEIVYDKIHGLTEIARQADPTRDWVQSDGDKDLDGRLNVYTIHTGDKVNETVPEDKLWGVTEGGSSYYGKPGYYEKYVGDRAYRSVKDRMDGLAIEDYNLIKTLRADNADIINAWCLAWHALKPLPLGLCNLSAKELKITDGVFFGPYQEGKPGVQPERIAPFSMMLNPGFDPSLPLYDPYPLFLAIQAANHPDGPQPCEWDRVDVKHTASQPVDFVAPVENIDFRGDMAGNVYSNLKSIGVPFNKSEKIPDFLLINLADIDPGMTESLQSEIEKVTGNMGTVFLSGISPDNQSLANALLPEKVVCIPDKSSSLLPEPNDPRTASLSYKELYFAEDPTNNIISGHTLSGAFTENGKALLYRNSTEWLRWLNGGEYTKTISVFRSEFENEKLPVLVEYEVNGGRIIVSTIDLTKMGDAQAQLFRKLFANFGIRMNESYQLAIPSFDGRTLTRSLSLGRFGDTGIESAMEREFIPESSIEPKENDAYQDKTWKMVNSRGGRFNLKDLNQSGPENIFVSYFSYWIYSPLDLSNLLNSGPDMPQLDKTISVSDNGKLYVNGVWIKPDETGTLDYRLKQTYKGIPLKAGWNHFLVKVVSDSFHQPEMGTLQVEIDSNKTDFIEKLKTSVRKPE
jgi:hypothetical protein